MTFAKTSFFLLFAALFAASLSASAAALELGGRKDASSSGCAESSDSCSAVPAAGKKGALDLKPLPQLPAPSATAPAVKPSSATAVARPAEGDALASTAAAPVQQPAPAAPAPASDASCGMPAWLKICAALAAGIVAFMAWKIFSGGKK